LRQGLWDDLIGYALVQSYLLGLVIARLTAWIDGATGLSRLHLVSDWSVAVQFAFFIVTHDLYSFHRLQHRSPFLWRIHEAHHATRDVDWLSGLRSHAIEILINQTIEFAPILLLGAAPEVALIKLTVDALWGCTSTHVAIIGASTIEIEPARPGCIPRENANAVTRRFRGSRIACWAQPTLVYTLANPVGLVDQAAD
jgi:hypothetical protein